MVNAAAVCCHSVGPQGYAASCSAFAAGIPTALSAAAAAASAAAEPSAVAQPADSAAAINPDSVPHATAAPVSPFSTGGAPASACQLPLLKQQGQQQQHGHPGLSGIQPPREYPVGAALNEQVLLTIPEDQTTCTHSFHHCCP